MVVTKSLWFKALVIYIFMALGVSQSILYE